MHAEYRLNEYVEKGRKKVQHSTQMSLQILKMQETWVRCYVWKFEQTCPFKLKSKFFKKNHKIASHRTGSPPPTQASCCQPLQVIRVILHPPKILQRHPLPPKSQICKTHSYEVLLVGDGYN